jgi:hypothetical protein
MHPATTYMFHGSLFPVAPRLLVLSIMLSDDSLSFHVKWWFFVGCRGKVPDDSQKGLHITLSEVSSIRITNSMSIDDCSTWLPNHVRLFFNKDLCPIHFLFIRVDIVTPERSTSTSRLVTLAVGFDFA